MKNILLIILFAIISYTSSAQIKNVEILKDKVANLDCYYKKSIDLDKGDTLYYVYIGFQNAEYTSIVDIKSVMLNKSQTLIELIKDLKASLPEMDTKTSISWNRDYYSISLYDFSKQMYFGQPLKKGKGYVNLNKNDVQLLIEWLETIKFGIG